MTNFMINNRQHIIKFKKLPDNLKSYQKDENGDFRVRDMILKLLKPVDILNIH